MRGMFWLVALVLASASIFVIPPPARLTVSDPENCSKGHDLAPSPPVLRENAEVDVVVFGATGFTGKLTARYLANRPGNFTFAIAGRNQRKLEDLAATFDKAPVIILADAGDLDSLRALVRRARVVITTVCLIPFP